MSNTFEGVRLFTGVFTAKFEGDYIPVDQIESYLQGWLESGLSDRDVFLSLRNITTGDVDAFDVEILVPGPDSAVLTFTTAPAAGSVRVNVLAAPAAPMP